MEKLDLKNVEGKKVILRTDINLPIENGELKKTIRFEKYAKTIERLSKNGAKTLIIAHQGRPGRKDFKSLEQHREILTEQLNQEVSLIKQFFTPKIGNEIEEMENGEVSLLENIRFLSEELQNYGPEKHKQDHFVKNISQFFDIYVNDAFSAAHRSHGSLVGFNQRLDSYPGPIMYEEFNNCQKIKEEFEEGVMVLGGEKPGDIIGIMHEMLNKVDKILLGGIPGEVANITQGNKLGRKKEWIENKNFNTREKELKRLIEENRDKIVVPEDFETTEGNYSSGDVPEDEITWDIGKKTRQNYSKIIRNSDAVVMKGPMGAFDQGHEEGTKRMIKCIAESEGFTVLGGGHTSSLVKRYGYDLNDFSHVSIAGGAFVRFMSGEKLPAIEALKTQD